MKPIARVVQLRGTRSWSVDPDGYEASLAEQVSLASTGMSYEWCLGALLELCGPEVIDEDYIDWRLENAGDQAWIDFLCGMDEMGEVPEKEVSQ